MTPLRQKMVDLMTFRQYSPKTHIAYLSISTRLATYYHRSPEKISIEEIKQWLIHTANERHWSASTTHQAINGLKFLYHQVLEYDNNFIDIPLPKRPQKSPVLLTQTEVYHLLHHANDLKKLTMLSVCYGCGLRVSELVALNQDDIDTEHLMLRIVQSKGKKDRNIPLSMSLLKLLRHYWQAWHPNYYLFCRYQQRVPMSISSAQKIFTQVKSTAGINKKGGIHSLRHAYATHQLEQGLPIHQLQQFMGHSDIKVTMRYLHWLPESQVLASDLLEKFIPDEAIMQPSLKRSV